MPSEKNKRTARLNKISRAVEALENSILELHKTKRLGVPPVSGAEAFRSLYYLQRLAKKAK